MVWVRHLIQNTCNTMAGRAMSIWSNLLTKKWLVLPPLITKSCLYRIDPECPIYALQHLNYRSPCFLSIHHYTRWTQIWLLRLNTVHTPNRKGGLSSFNRPSLTAHLLPRSWGIPRTSLRSHGCVSDWRCKRGCGMMQGNSMAPRDGKFISNRIAL